MVQIGIMVLEPNCGCDKLVLDHFILSFNQIIHGGNLLVDGSRFVLVSVVLSPTVLVQVSFGPFKFFLHILIFIQNLFSGP